MPKSPAQIADIPLASPAYSADPHPEDPAWAAWQAHVDARRIGTGTRTTRALLAELVHNEMVLLGRGGVL